MPQSNIQSNLSSQNFWSKYENEYADGWKWMSAITHPAEWFRSRVLGGDDQRTMQDMTNDYNRAVALENWQMQNEYNSPIQQMARLREAGLNPHLAANGNIEASQPGQPSASAPDVRGNVLDALGFASNVLTDYIRIRKEVATLGQIEAQTNRINTDTSWISRLNALRAMLMGKQANKTDFDTAKMIQDLEIGDLSMLGRYLGYSFSRDDDGNFSWDVSKVNRDRFEQYINEMFKSRISDFSTNIDTNTTKRALNALSRMMNDRGLTLSDSPELRLLANSNGGDLGPIGLLVALYGEKALDAIMSLLPKFGRLFGKNKQPQAPKTVYKDRWTDSSGAFDSYIVD